VTVTGDAWERADDWDGWVHASAAKIRSQGRWRQIRVLDGAGPSVRLPDGRQVVSFASNDYLGLASHPTVVAAARQALDRWGAGSGSSRLIAGGRPIHADLEQQLAEWRRAAAAVVLPTGYQANLAALTTFGVGARIVSDELNHASIIDGARLSRAEVVVYRHGDADHAAALLKEAPGRALLVTDSVFSMDGDLAPVRELSEVCARYGALLLLDDAHAVLDLPGVEDGVMCIRVGTLSKALGSQGGFITGPRKWMELVINRARAFIFTTGLAPSCAAAALAAVGICRSNEGEVLRAGLRAHVDTLRPGHPTPIVPVLLGDEQAALDASQTLLDLGLFVPAIRPPSVPAGTSRLRISLSAAHSQGDVEGLVRALAGIQ
jgi:8-amino-7-oxononanoate synthase